MAVENSQQIIQECADFLEKSSARYATTLLRASKDLTRYSGGFWDDDMKKYRTGRNRIYLSLNNWNVLCNAIASPLSASPWHTELKVQTQDFKLIQEAIDALEADNDLKSALIDAFRKCVLTGYGFLVVSTDVDEFTSEPRIVLESVKQLQSVALDPSIMTVSGSDAEEGALVNYIGVKKARRLYGDDVAPFDYPRTSTIINFGNMRQWGCPADQVAVVSYYVKENDGVHFYKIVGDKVVQDVTLPIKFIPIIRFAGNEIYENDQINYDGIIRQTLDLELGANQAYSTLIERCGRSVKASYLSHVKAFDGLEKQVQACDKEDAMAVYWKGDVEPKPLVEQFQTGDLQAVIQTTRTLMEDVVGIPLTGIPDSSPEKTATEIMRQQTSKESNTAQYFNHAFTASQVLSKIFIELLNGGEDLQFTLENGPSVITRQMKARQELTALGAICPDEMKPVLAVYFAKTLEDDIGEDMTNNMIANLPPNIQYLDEESEMDGQAVHTLEQMKAVMEQQQAMLDEQIAKNKELEDQLQMMQIDAVQAREDRMLDWQKFSIAERDKMALETAKLEKDGVVDGTKLQLDAQKLMVEAQKNQAKAQNDTDKVMLDAMKQAGAEQQAYANGEQAGYEQGASDGVNAAFGR
jgi:hypothetical protein